MGHPLRAAIRRHSFRLRSCVPFLLAVVASCGGDPAQPDVPPAVTITATAGSGTIASGSTVQLTATLTDKRGKTVSNAPFTWSSANSSVATVSASGLVTGAVAGSSTISATSTGTTGTFTVTVTPGAPARLVVTTQPTGAASGTRLATQPVVEVRDLADNLVPTATSPVSVTLVGSGTLTGTTIVSAVQGVARFTDLTVSGLVGGRSLQFFSAGLSAVTSGAFALQAGPPSAITIVGTLPTLRSGLAVAAPIVTQLRDRDGNETTLAGKRVVATVSGGTGVTAISNATAITDALGRASFPALTVSGLTGTRQLTFTADTIATTATATVSLVGGRATRLTLERDVPLAVDAGVPMSPVPLVRLIDSVGNTAPDAGVAVRASLVGGAGSLANDIATSDTIGRVTFTALTVQGTSGAVTVQFSAPGFTSIVSRATTVAAGDTTVQPAFITTSASAADTAERVIILGSTTASVTPYLQARNATNAPISTAGVRWIARDPSRASVAADGRITGLREGRTFIVAQASRTPTVADSVLVFVPKNATGPILRTTLPSYRITTDTFSILIQVESRDGRALSAADVQVAWPGASANPYSPFTVTGVQPLRAGVVASFVDGQETLGITWASTTPVTGTVTLVRLICRVNQRGVANQVLLTMRQLVASDLSDLTALVSVFNPVVIIP
jgi:hypothetical protein